MDADARLKFLKDFIAVVRCLADGNAPIGYLRKDGGKIHRKLDGDEDEVLWPPQTVLDAREQKQCLGTFRGLRVASAAPPASGITCVQMLQALDRFAAARCPSRRKSYVLLAGAMHEAFAARLRAVADPDFVEVPVAELTSSAWADAAAAHIRARARGPAPASVGGEGTTHVSTYDEDGNAVALTHTLGIFSGVIVPGTGIAAEQRDGPLRSAAGRTRTRSNRGKARVSGMAPTIVSDGRRPAIVSGAPGTNAIVTSVLQVIVGLVDGKLTPVEAVSSPRVHCEGGPVFVEGRVSRRGRAGARRGWIRLARDADQLRARLRPQPGHQRRRAWTFSRSLGPTTRRRHRCL